MASNELPRMKTFQRQSSAAQLGGRKTSSNRMKEESQESLVRGKKRSRMSASSAPVYTGPGQTAESQSPPCKRKSPSSERDDRPAKRARRTLSPTEKTESQSQKSSPSESAEHQAPTEASTGNAAPPHSEAAFEAKYEMEHMIGSGGFATVFAGHRRKDNLPVAIKCTDKSLSDFTQIEVEGRSCSVPLEVALLLKLQPKAAESSAVVALLDWYDLDTDFFLVLERPEPCMDMADYAKLNQYGMSEIEAKNLTKQLLDAIIEIHSKGVFHNDIKPENILVEIGSAVPRIRLIDFDCGTFLSEERCYTEQETSLYTNPEWFMFMSCEAESTSVWQLGITVFRMMYPRLPFNYNIFNEDSDYELSLSDDCWDFLMMCLDKTPESRPTLRRLKRHSWLV